jgi:nucleoside phosphorylase
MSMVMTKTPILLCAATKWEAEPLAKALSLRCVSAFRWEGSVGCADVVLIKTGVGPANAREALASVSAPKLLLSTGFAGALQPKMFSGDLVLDVQGLDLETPPMIRELASEKGLPFHFGKIIHSDAVLHRPEDKRALGLKNRAAAVDMESQAIRQAAERLGVPFLAARVVLDSLDDRLPSAVPAGEAISDLVPYVLTNLPELPLMLKTGLLQKNAISNLAGFLTALLPKL